MLSPAAPVIYGETDLDYNRYLMIDGLLKLQIPQSKPAHHDELLFIIIHQAYELWFKLILHEIETAISHIEEARILEAHHFVSRVVAIMKLLVQQIHLLETMRPVDFLKFRDRLKPASGFQSLQFREIEFMAGLKDEAYLRYFANRPAKAAALRRRMRQTDLRSAYAAMLRKVGLAKRGSGKGWDSVTEAILPVYKNPAKHLELYLLTEALLEFDQHLSLWREHHVRVVERIIGTKPGTGGSAGVEYLRQTTSKKCFPELWEVRNRL